jgi:hypothetical protein
VLRAVGAGPAITSSDGLLGIVAAVIIGSLLAAGLEVALSTLAPIGPVRAVDISRSVDFDWTVIGLGVLALVLGVGGSAVAIAYRQAPHRFSARVARGRPNGNKSSVVKLAVAAGLPVSGIAGLRFSLESGRHTVPVRSVIAGAVLAITVVTATLTFGASLNTLISHPNLYGWNFDYAYYSTDGYGPVPTAIVQPLLARDHFVATTTGVYFATVEIQGQVVPLLVEPAHAAIAPRVLTGHRMDHAGQIVLGSATLAQLHKKIGDKVVVQGDGLPKRQLVIVGTATLPTIGTVIGVHPTMTAGAVIPASAVPGSLLNQFGPDSGPNALFIRIRPGADPVAAERSLAKIAKESLRQFITPQVAAAEGPNVYGDTLQLLGAQRPAEIVNYRTMGTTPGLLAGGLALGAVAALGLILVASVRQRRRELALLKSFASLSDNWPRRWHGSQR